MVMAVEVELVYEVRAKAQFDAINESNPENCPAAKEFSELAERQNCGIRCLGMVVGSHYIEAKLWA
jgi:hypothetical protein